MQQYDLFGGVQNEQQGEELDMFGRPKQQVPSQNNAQAPENAQPSNPVENKPKTSGRFKPATAPRSLVPPTAPTTKKEAFNNYGLNNTNQNAQQPKNRPFNAASVQTNFMGGGQRPLLESNVSTQ